MSRQRDLLKAAFAAGELKRYKKFGTVHARPAVNGERIVTILDGVKETENTAKHGDIVVTGPKGEEYIIGKDKFKSRYKSTAKHGEYEPIGEGFATRYTGEEFRFPAPWGEEMLIQPGDYLYTPAIGSDDIYRIEAEVFKQTYRRV